MKLNFTKEEVCKPVEGGRSAREVLNYREDWLILHAEVEAQTKLIEQLETALEHYSHRYDTEEYDNFCNCCGVKYVKFGISHDANCEVGLALSAVNAWRKEQK